MAPVPSNTTKIFKVIAALAIIGLSVWSLREMVSETQNIVGGKRAVMPKTSTDKQTKARQNMIKMLIGHYKLSESNLKLVGSILEVSTTEEVAKKIIDDAYDFDFSLRELHIEKIVCRVRGSEDTLTYVTTPNFLGIGVTPDLVLCELLDAGGAYREGNKLFWLREILLNEAKKHVQRYLIADPNNPILLLNQGILKEKAGEADPYQDLIKVRNQGHGKKGGDQTEVNRAKLTAQLLQVIECDTTKSTKDELADIVCTNLPKDYFQTYLLSRIYHKFKDFEKEKAALAQFDEERDHAHRLFVTMVCALSASLALFMITCFSRRKLWRLPSPEIATICPNPYGWTKPTLIVLMASGITCILIVVLWIQCPPLVLTGGVPLVSVFNPDKVALLELLHQLATTVPFIILTFLFVHGTLSFTEFVRLKLPSNGYTGRQLVALGIGGFSICWMLANISMLLSMWYHYPGDTAVTVGTGLLASSHSSLAILFLFTGTAICAPITEEIIFRGILHPALRRHLDGNTVMLLGSLIFAVSHLEFTPWWFVHKFFLGYMNAYLVEKTGSIIPGIINHMLLNAFVVLFLCVCS